MILKRFTGDKLIIPFTQVLIKVYNPYSMAVDKNEYRWLAIPKLDNTLGSQSDEYEINLAIHLGGNRKGHVEFDGNYMGQFDGIFLIREALNAFLESPEEILQQLSLSITSEILDRNMGSDLEVEMPMPLVTSDTNELTEILKNEDSSILSDLLGDLDKFYDEINLLDAKGPDRQKTLEIALKDNKVKTVEEEFFEGLLRLLYQEPAIVRVFFSEISPNTEGALKPSLDSTFFDPKNILFSQVRLDAIIETKANPDTIDRNFKSEGIFLYNNGGTYINESDLNYFLGYSPFAMVEINNSWKLYFLANRNIRYSFQYDHPLILEEEHGWIFPNAENVTRSGNIGKNHLILHWLGESLGAEPNLNCHNDDDPDLTPDQDNKFNEFISNFIQKYLFKKTVESPKKQLPLLDGRTYRFGLIPMYVHGLYPLIEGSIENYLTTNLDSFSKEISFNLIDPIASPEIIPTHKDLNEFSNNRQLVFKYRIPKRDAKSRKFDGKDSAIFLIAPPPIEFNLAKWLGTFQNAASGNPKDVAEAIRWIRKLEKASLSIEKETMRELWENNFDNEIPYLFDKRVLKKNLVVTIKELSGTKSIRLNPQNTELLRDVRGIHMRFQCVEDSLISDSISDYVVTNQVNYGILIKVPPGRTFNVEFNWEGTKNPASSLKVISAAPKLIPKLDISHSRSLKLRVKKYQRTISSAVNKNIDQVEFEIPEMNFNIGSYIYLFRRYLSVNPSNHNELPELDTLIARRKKLTSEISANEEADEYLFNSQNSKKKNKSTNFNEFAEIEKEEIAESVPAPYTNSTLRSDDKSKSKNSDILAIHNVFTLDEVFGEVRLEILKPSESCIDSTEGQEMKVIDHKIHFVQTKSFGKVNFKTVFNDDHRAKSIDYFHLKAFSRHLQYYKGDEIKRSLNSLDAYDTLRASKENQQILNHGFGEEKNLIKHHPPKFELELLFLMHQKTKKVNSTTTKSTDRLPVLKITFNKNEINHISDDEYIGIDFGPTKEIIAGKAVSASNTDIAVDFTLQTRDTEHQMKTNAFDEAVFVSESALNSNKKQVKFSWETGTPNNSAPIWNNYRFYKPVFLYDQNQAAIFLNLGDFIKKDSIELDPFLKLSLCRGYQDGRGQWKATPSSDPQFIQLSSHRSVSITKGKSSYSVSLQFPFQNEENDRTHYFVAFYDKKANEFRVPVESSVKIDGQSTRGKYLLLKNFERIVISPDKQIDDRGRPYEFIPTDYVMRIFEFNVYDNPEFEWDPINIDPFDSPYFKLIFTC
jgi:hypothetical protein